MLLENLEDEDGSTRALVFGVLTEMLKQVSSTRALVFGVLTEIRNRLVAAAGPWSSEY